MEMDAVPHWSLILIFDHRVEIGWPFSGDLTFLHHRLATETRMGGQWAKRRRLSLSLVRLYITLGVFLVILYIVLRVYGETLYCLCLWWDLICPWCPWWDFILHLSLVRLYILTLFLVRLYIVFVPGETLYCTLWDFILSLSLVRLYIVLVLDDTLYFPWYPWYLDLLSLFMSLMKPSFFHNLV